MLLMIQLICPYFTAKAHLPAPAKFAQSQSNTVFHLHDASAGSDRIEKAQQAQMAENTASYGFTFIVCPSAGQHQKHSGCPTTRRKLHAEFPVAPRAAAAPQASEAGSAALHKHIACCQAALPLTSFSKLKVYHHCAAADGMKQAKAFARP